MDVSWIISQVWFLPVSIGVGAFLVGMLISRRSTGSNGLAHLVFWPLSLLRDLLDMAHTKRLQYYMLLLTLIGMEVFFSFRAATVYYDILDTRMSGFEVGLVSSIAFVAVFLSGYIVASHGIKNAQGQTDKGNVWLAVLVVAHDFTGIVWFMYGGASSTPNLHDWTTVLSTIGMCAFSVIPFALGSRAAKLRPELEAEMEQEVSEFTSAATRKIKRRAVDRVLRLAGRTDVIHLVRSLPAAEFADFKAFVMPIIAPGTPFNLSDPEQSERGQIDTQETTHVESHLPVKKIGRNQSSDILKTTQNALSKSIKVSNQGNVKKPSNEQSMTPQNDSSGGRQIESAKPVTKTVQLYEKIRQYAATHDMTQKRLSKHFKVSLSTIARALADSKPSTNGYHKERTTDEMEAIVVSAQTDSLS